MKKRFLIVLVISSFLAIQLWCLFVTFNNGYYGVKVDKNAKKEWTITSFEASIVSLPKGLQMGDIIVKVNGEAPDNYKILKKFHKIEQAETVTVLRNGVTFDIAIKYSGILNVEYISLFAEIICFCMAGVIYLKIADNGLRSFSRLYCL